MAKKDWWFKFEFDKWLNDDCLNRGSLQMQGFWIRCCAKMAKSETYFLTGTVQELSRLLSVFPEEFVDCVNELDRTGTADVTLEVTPLSQDCHGNVTIMSRKFKRDLKSKESSRLRKAKSRGHTDVTPDVTPSVTPNVTDKSQSGHASRVKSKEFKEKEKEKNTKKKKKKISIPDDFKITEKMRDWANEKVPKLDIDYETQNFVDHFRNKGETGLDWVAKWRTWMRNAFTDFGNYPGGKPGLGEKHGTSSHQKSNARKPGDKEKIEESAKFYENYPA